MDVQKARKSADRIASPRCDSRARVFGLVGITLLLALFAGTAWTAWLGKCATFDEPLHFMGAWLQTHYDDFRCNPEDPPLWKYYVAVGTRMEDLQVDRQSPLWARMLQDLPAPAVHFFAQTLYETPGNDADALIRAGRARMLLIALFLGGTIGWWAWRLRGPLAAVVAVGAFCLDPNFLAHGLLIKNDIAISLCFLLLMAAVWLLGERATWVRWAGVCLLVGVAFSVKFSGILAIPMLAMTLGCRVFIRKPWPVLGLTATRWWQRLIAAASVTASACVVGYVMIWACYGFRFLPTENPKEQFEMENIVKRTAIRTVVAEHPNERINDARMQELVYQWRPSPTIRFVLWGQEHHFLPQTWLAGFLYTYGEALDRRTYLCGQIDWLGWWYYFPYAMAFKTPVATLAGLGLAGFFWLWWRRWSALRDRWPLYAAIFAPAIYMVMAMRTHLNIGLRHVLPVYPYLFIFLGVMAAEAVGRRRRIALCVIAILGIGLAVETYSAYPDYIPFFNVAAGGSRGGLGLLSDSNIDWGQDLPALAKWQADHPDRQLYLCHFGAPDPRYYKLHYIDMDGSFMDFPDEKEPSGLPPVYAISAVALQTVYMNPAQTRLYEHFRRLQPEAVLDGCIYLYDEAPKELIAP